MNFKINYDIAKTGAYHLKYSVSNFQMVRILDEGDGEGVKEKAPVKNRSF